MKHTTRKIKVNRKWLDRLTEKFNLVHGFNGFFNGQYDGFKTYKNGVTYMHFYV